MPFENSDKDFENESVRDAGSASGRAYPVLRLLQHPASSYGTGPTHPGCGVLRAGRGEHGGLKPGGDFT